MTTNSTTVEAKQPVSDACVSRLVRLLPCPFCGANGTYPEDMEPIGELYCQCSDDKCRTFGPSGKTWLEAGQRWNLRTNDPKEKAHLTQEWPTDMLHTTIFGSSADFQMLLEVEASQGLSSRRESRMRQRLIGRETYQQALLARQSGSLILREYHPPYLGVICRWVQSLLHPQKTTKTKQPN